MPDPAGSVHQRFVAPRRVRTLARLLAPLLPERGRVLDVGCGDGELARAILQLRPGLEICGVEVLLRGACAIEVSRFDGVSIPFPGRAFDAVLLADVVHHAADPRRLLREAARVAPVVVMKDHLAEGVLAAATLRFMDRVGNARHGVALPYCYWRRAEWRDEIEHAGLAVTAWEESLHLYPWPATWLFDRSLHFIARMEAGDAAAHA